MSKRQSGWRRDQDRRLRGDFTVPVEPSQWETMLKGLSMSNAEALTAIRQGHAGLLDWIRAFRLKHYAPEEHLEAAGMSVKEWEFDRRGRW